MPKRSPQLQFFLHSCLGPDLLTNLPQIPWLEILLTLCPKQNKPNAWLLSLQPRFFPSAFLVRLSSKLSGSQWHLVTSSESWPLLLKVCLFCYSFCLLFRHVALLMAELSLTVKKALSSGYIPFFLKLFHFFSPRLGQRSPRKPDQFQESPWVGGALRQKNWIVNFIFLAGAYCVDLLIVVISTICFPRGVEIP